MNALICFEQTIDPLKGGVERMCTVLKDALERLNIRVYVLCFYKTSDFGQNFITYLPNHKLYSIENEKFFLNYLFVNKISVVINQGGTYPHSSPFCLYCKSINIPIVTVFHNTLFGMYGRYNPFRSCTFFRSIFSNTFFSILFIILFKIKYGVYYKKIVRESDSIVLLSKCFQNEIEFYSSTKILNKIFVIPNPTPPSIPFHKTIIKENIILFCGRLNWQKRPDYILKIWKRIYMEYPNWELIILGDGDMKRELQDYIIRKHLDRVQIKGFVNPVEYYEKSKILCMTSLYESFGLVLLEAMNYQCVPIAFKSYPNVIDIISHNHDGILIPPFDIDCYAKELSYLMHNEEKLLKLQINTKDKINKFSIQNFIYKWEILLNDLCKK